MGKGITLVTEKRFPVNNKTKKGEKDYEKKINQCIAYYSNGSNNGCRMRQEVRRVQRWESAYSVYAHAGRAGETGCCSGAYR